jgi:hypothetical protein
MEHITLEQVIRQHIQLDSANQNGWNNVLCKICDDKGHKGKRAGFRFEGEIVGYNCFNCGHAALFDPQEQTSLSRKMVTVLESFGLKKEDWQQAIFFGISNTNDVSVKEKKRQIYEPKAITLPDYFTPVVEHGDDFDNYAIEYLRDERKVDWTKYPFYLGRKTANPSSDRWYGRLIIPFFKDNKLVFFQGRDLSDTRLKKYLNADVPKENILYGYEDIFKKTTEPLYIVEGWFDAWHLNGVAVLGNRMTPHQLYWIAQSNRQKVVIPDRFGDGHLLAEQAIELGWSVSTPDIGDCKDPNEAIMKYGKLYTLMTIRTHTYDNFEAALHVKFYCEKRQNETRRST